MENFNFGNETTLAVNEVKKALQLYPEQTVLDALTDSQRQMLIDYVEMALDYSDPVSKEMYALYMVAIHTEPANEKAMLQINNDVHFLWNGIKINGELYKGSYSTGPYTEESQLPEGTVTVYMERSNTPRINGLEVYNDSDIMTDYFEDDTVRVRPDSPYYQSAVSGANAYNIHMEKQHIKHLEKMFAKYLGTPRGDSYRSELEQHRSILAELKKSDNSRTTRKRSTPQK